MNFWPLFAFEAIAESIDPLGEDAYFFRLLREARVPIYVDHALSWSVHHLFQKRLTIADTLRDKDAYLATAVPKSVR